MLLLFVCITKMKIKILVEKTVSAVVIDGVTVGRPCCGVHNCKDPLPTNRHRFCVEHQDLANVCAIVGCDQPIVAGKRTCNDSVHQDIERIHTERGQAQFQLQERLKRARVAHPNDAVAGEGGMPEDDKDEEEFEIPIRPENEGPKLKKIRAQFGRKRTHNEQIIVAPCGIILARETFYGAESIRTVAVGRWLLLVPFPLADQGFRR
jgi:hypothetical protein